MIYIINNNTTHNYSRYSTGPSRIYSALLNVKCPHNMINHYAWFDSNQPYVFQTKQLLCWGPDIALFNLRHTFSNIFKALQICWSAARNNKKILFINGKDSIVAESTLVNTWLMQQYKRHTMPRKLNNICNVGSKYTSHLKSPFFGPASHAKVQTKGKYSINPSFENKALFNHLSTFLNSCCIKMPGIVNTKALTHSFIKNSNSLFNCILTEPKQYPDQPKSKHNGYTGQLNSETISKHRQGVMIGKPLYNNENQSIVSNYNLLKIKTKNAIRLQVKEGQTLTQQIAGEITVPLVGFFTNTKTGFNTLQNQLNDEFYNQSKSVHFSNCLNSRVNHFALAKNLRWRYNDISNHNYKTRSNKFESNCSTYVYHQYYLPFSFYIRPVNDFGLLVNQQCKQKQHMVRQNVFGKILSWRLKSQHPSSLFYSQLKQLDQRNKYKSKQLTMANQNNIDGAVYQLKLASSKSQVLFNNSNKFITFRKPVRLVQRTNKTSVQFYSNFKPSSIDKQTANQSTMLVSSVDTSLTYCKNKCVDTRKAGFKNIKSSSINNVYISRFYQSIKTSTAVALPDLSFTFAPRLWASGKGKAKGGQGAFKKAKGVSKNQNRNSLTSNKYSGTELFTTNYVFKAYKGSSKQLMSKQFRYDKKKFRNYYDKLINSNQLNQYQMFAKSPYVNNKLADIIFFINPEKNQNLVNQANCLKIPTIGVISGMANSELGRRSCNHYSLNNLVNYPILGNPSSSFFIYTLIGMFIKALRSS